MTVASYELLKCIEHVHFICNYTYFRRGIEKARFQWKRASPLCL